jgi:hypothetical protein
MASFPYLRTCVLIAKSAIAAASTSPVALAATAVAVGGAAIAVPTTISHPARAAQQGDSGIHAVVLAGDRSGAAQTP